VADRPDDRIGRAGGDEGGDGEAPVAIAAARERPELAQQERPVDRAARAGARRVAEDVGVGVELVVRPSVARSAAAADELAHEDRQPAQELLAADRERERELVPERHHGAQRRPGPPRPRMEDAHRRDAAHAVRRGQRGEQRGQPAPVVAREVGAVEVEGVEQGDEIGGVRLLRVRPRRRVAPPEAAQVRAEHAPLLGERGQEPPPRPPVLRPAVHEHQRRAVPGLGDVQTGAVGQDDVAVHDRDALDLRERPRRHSELPLEVELVAQRDAVGAGPGRGRERVDRDDLERVAVDHVGEQPDRLAVALGEQAGQVGGGEDDPVPDDDVGAPQFPHEAGERRPVPVPDRAHARRCHGAIVAGPVGVTRPAARVG